MAKFNYQEYLASREWGLLKVAVRQRSGGTCERCKQAPHEQTHHVTYERIGHELLTDLLGVCRPCHEYLSGLTDHDPSVIAVPPATPVTPILRDDGTQAWVYLAGKIAKNDWRHDLFPSLRDAILESDVADEHYRNNQGRKSHEYISTVITPGILNCLPERDGLLYGGPYFVGCDHGCYHGDSTHGQNQECSHSAAMCDECNGQGGSVDRSAIPDSCLSLIRRSDFVFCWLNDPRAYGTVFELGYAYALDKPVFLATNTDEALIRDTWFAGRCASGSWQRGSGKGEFQTHIAAWDKFIASILCAF